jgi:hypothetical protein
MEKQTALQTSQTDISLASESTDSTEKTTHLTRKETRRIVTPYAFFVADDLLGTPLAGPFRRGFGMLIDLIFVILLTQVSSLVLAAVAAWTFFRAGNRLQTKKRFNVARIFLRLLVALLLFVLAMGIFDEMTGNNSTNIALPAVSDYIVDGVEGVDGIEVDGLGLIALTAKYLIDTKTIKQQINQGDCEPAYDCLQTLGEELVQDIVDIGLDRDAIDGILEGYLGAVTENLSPEQHTELTKHIQQFVETKQTSINSLERMSTELVSAEQAPIEPIIIEPAVQVSNKDKQGPESGGFFDWLENLAEELGIGLGWAMFYFSIFTAWWKGQTPGKKLLGMKVIKLDNKPLNLWESFGRYGGYAAGLATGFTGFVQVFWDPNRQAIQDKISETLVIDLRKPKVSFVKEMAE